METSLAVQWLRLCAPNVGGMISVPGWGAKIPACPAVPPPHPQPHPKQKTKQIASRRYCLQEV